MQFGLMQAPPGPRDARRFNSILSTWLTLDGRHCGSYFLFAKLCIEGNDDLCRGKSTPPFAERTNLFEGSGGFLSGALTTSCEALARFVSIRTGGHLATIDPALTLPGQRQGLLPGGRPTCLQVW